MRRLLKVTLAAVVPAVLLAAQQYPKEKPQGKSAQGKAVQGKAHGKAAQRHTFVIGDRVEWKAAPASLPAGAEAAVIDGNPMKGGIFTMRLKLPDGYRIPPHFHAAQEHVTVISGTFLMGLGDAWSDAALTELTAGSFAVMGRGTRHFAGARGETVVQVHAMGPWKLTYVNAADDPRGAPGDRAR